MQTASKYLLVSVNTLNRFCDVHTRRIGNTSSSVKTLQKSARRLRRNIIKYSKTPAQY